MLAKGFENLALRFHGKRLYFPNPSFVCLKDKAKLNPKVSASLLARDRHFEPAVGFASQLTKERRGYFCLVVAIEFFAPPRRASHGN
jgi:hypothetical protein